MDLFVRSLFETKRVKDFLKRFVLITDEGPVAKAGLDLLKAIGHQLLSLRAFAAKASREEDKIMIHHHIANARIRKGRARSLEQFRLIQSELNDSYFDEFDLHVCSLLGTSMLPVSLEVGNPELATLALAMGAEVSAIQLEMLAAIGVDLAAPVETRDGCYALSVVVAKAGNLDALRSLIERKADIEAMDQNCTALHYAARFGYMEMASYLIEQGSNLEAKDRVNEETEGVPVEFTPLCYAAQMGNLSMVSMLLQYGARPEARDCWGGTALHWAAVGGFTEVVLVLLERGAKLEAQTTMVSIGFTALHMAAYGGHAGVASILLDRGAELEARFSFYNNKGWSALHCAAHGGHTEVASTLLDRGAELETKDNKGCTALHWAADRGHTEVASMLLERGVELEAKNNDGRTALDAAEECDQQSVANLLRAKMQ